jgi:two-component system nitrogen regulation sensor histidine kinase NtrY
MFENTVQVARATYQYELGRVAAETTAMSGNMADGLTHVPIDDPRVAQALAAQTFLRSLNEAAILKISPNGEVQTFGVINGYDGMINPARLSNAVARLSRLPGDAVVEEHTPNRISVLTVFTCTRRAWSIPRSLSRSKAPMGCCGTITRSSIGSAPISFASTPPCCSGH